MRNLSVLQFFACFVFIALVVGCVNATKRKGAQAVLNYRKNNQYLKYLNGYKNISVGQ